MYAINRSPSVLPSNLVALTSAAVVQSFTVLEQCQVSDIFFVISTAVVSSGNVVVTFKRRPTIGSATGEVSIGTVVIPGGAAVGKVYYKKVSPVVCAVGEQIVIEVTTAAAGGGAAGNGQGFFEAEQDPETPANNADMILSA
ncbi:MAG: hypothetical protein EBX40_00570 [Gammaproteobacteria bacterium]|nr:hypothetical protein [Gammaproteobacteria bacterium]